MGLEAGQVVWISFAAGSSLSTGGGPQASVDRGVVINGEHGVIRRDNGHVGVVYSVEECHVSEADAWAAAAAELERHVETVRHKITECRLAAAKAAIMAEASA